MGNEKIKLLTVEDTFFIEGRGVMVMPMITDYKGPTSFAVVLKKPGCEESVAKACLEIPRLNPPRVPHPFACSLPGLRKHEVPVGTEIWISSQSACE
jgi:hypothetical protein